MAAPTNPRERALPDRLIQMQEMDEWHLFQNFVLALLPHDGYTDVRHSTVRNDYGRDAVARTPQTESCFVAVSFDGSLARPEDSTQPCGQEGVPMTRNRKERRYG